MPEAILLQDRDRRQNVRVRRRPLLIHRSRFRAPTQCGEFPTTRLLEWDGHQEDLWSKDDPSQAPPQVSESRETSPRGESPPRWATSRDLKRPRATGSTSRINRHEN